MKIKTLTHKKKYKKVHGFIAEEVKGRPKLRVRKFGRKTISVIPTGANGNFGHTGPRLSWEVGGGEADRTAAFWVAGLGQRRRLAGIFRRSPS